MDWVNAVIQGILLGGLYALFACGLSLMFGVMRIINLAHGDLAVLGAFLIFSLVSLLDISPWIALVIALPAAAAVGYVLQRGLLTPSLRAGELVPLLATFGLAIVIQNALLEGYSADSRSLEAGAIATSGIRLSDQITLPWLSITIFLVAVGVLLALQFMMRRTSMGRAMRATAADPDTAGIIGINAREVYARATAIAVALAVLAGAFFAMRTTFEPSSGPLQLIFAFEAVIIGGLGSLWGTLLGGIALGVAQTVGAQIDPSYTVLAGHLLFLAVLTLRPGGIFTVAVRA
jgi:branched-chain amino acid transport system permease protein